MSFHSLAQIVTLSHCCLQLRMHVCRMSAYFPSTSTYILIVYTTYLIQMTACYPPEGLCGIDLVRSVLSVVVCQGRGISCDLRDGNTNHHWMRSLQSERVTRCVTQQSLCLDIICRLHAQGDRAHTEGISITCGLSAVRPLSCDLLKRFHS